MQYFGHHLASLENKTVSGAAKWLGFGTQHITYDGNEFNALSQASSEDKDFVEYNSRLSVMESVRIRDWGSFTTAFHSLMSAHMIFAPAFYSVYDSFKRHADTKEISYFDFKGYAKPLFVNGVLGSLVTFVAAPFYALYNIIMRGYDGVTKNDITFSSAFFGTLNFVKLVVSNVFSAAVEMVLSLANFVVSLGLGVASIVTMPLSGLTQLAMHKFTSEPKPLSAQEQAEKDKALAADVKAKVENLTKWDENGEKNSLANVLSRVFYKSVEPSDETVKAINETLVQLNGADNKSDESKAFKDLKLEGIQARLQDKKVEFVVDGKDEDDQDIRKPLTDEQLQSFKAAIKGNLFDVAEGKTASLARSGMFNVEAAQQSAIVVAPVVAATS